MMAWPDRQALSSAASRQLLVCRRNRRPPPASAALAACRSCLPHRGPRYARIVPGTLRPAGSAPLRAASPPGHQARQWNAPTAKAAGQSAGPQAHRRRSRPRQPESPRRTPAKKK